MTHPDRSTDARAFFLVGPTAVGKSRVAHDLAKAGGHPVLSADSMLVYEGMDIGTAKPSAGERAEVQYFGIDLGPPTGTFSAGAFLEEAGKAIQAAHACGRDLVVTGGTGLYIRALLEGLDAGGPADPGTRETVGRIYREGGVAGLQEALQKSDPVRFQSLEDPSNPRRLTRALELSLAGRPPPGKKAGKTRGPLVGLHMERGRLHAAIEARVKRMYEAGLLEEVRGLCERFGDLSLTAGKAIGYAEALGVLKNELGMKEAMFRTAARTRQLAKRQVTWFRHQAEVTWVEVEPRDSIATIAGHVRRRWEEDGPVELAITSA